MTVQHTALVTGASSGIGSLTAAFLARNGYRVFGTSRTEHRDVPGGVEPIVLDVRSDASVRMCVQQVKARSGRIDLLVNNAGRAHASAIEETSLEQARDVFETNFWGVVRMTAAVLPTMREQRSGRIINVSSLAGLLGAVGQGFYSASKFALEGYSETLRAELDPFNIQVSLIEPGFFKTSLQVTTASPANAIADYAAFRRAVEVSIGAAISHGGDPRAVAETIVGVAKNKSPRLRYRVGGDAVWVPRLKALLPESLFALGMKRRFKVPSTP